MKRLSVSLVCVMFVATYAEEKSEAVELSESEGDKTSGKRWAQGDQSLQTPSLLSKELPSLDFQSETKGQERAKHEMTFKDFVGYEGIQSILLNALKPKPIVDTAEESEKWAPNEGSNAQFLGDLVVRGSETLSRALNTVIDVPKQAIYKLSAGATQALNQLGAYLVGL